MKVEFQFPDKITQENAIVLYNCFNKIRLTGVKIKVTIDGGAASMASILNEIAK